MSLQHRTDDDTHTMRSDRVVDTHKRSLDIHTTSSVAISGALIASIIAKASGSKTDLILALYGSVDERRQRMKASDDYEESRFSVSKTYVVTSIKMMGNESIVDNAMNLNESMRHALSDTFIGWCKIRSDSPLKPSLLEYHAAKELHKIRSSQFSSSLNGLLFGIFSRTSIAEMKSNSVEYVFYQLDDVARCLNVIPLEIRNMGQGADDQYNSFIGLTSSRLASQGSSTSALLRTAQESASSSVRLTENVVIDALRRMQEILDTESALLQKAGDLFSKLEETS
eukprot:TRINITY_DN2471_c0_g1_i1.p1 TRINITY_DN2471_c0_g1~~TRINITY_DN2471_c0_g1_i1.p1  ORF type:complete len:283 (-),score=55.09 TRINITY_DN2471_c0_g1_i1:306-1154(-)